MLIRTSARTLGIPNKNAATEPVHTPVTGNGMATKIIRASSPQVRYLLPKRLRVRSNSQVKKFLAQPYRLIKYPEIGPSSQMIGMAGTTEPTTAATYTAATGRS